MSKYISYRKGESSKLMDYPWQEISEWDQQVDALPHGSSIFPYSSWLHHSEQLVSLGQQKKIGAYFSAEDDILQDRINIQELMKHWEVIAIDFPIFRDGRGFSTAAILRETFSWDKELIATGDVLIDQLIQMSRVGFDGFVLRGDQKLDIALKQFERFPVKMQNDWRGLRTIRLEQAL